MIILGLDVGDRRIGVAIADTFTGLITPLPTHKASREFFNELAKLYHQHHFETVVLGMPLTLSGGRGEQAGKVAEVAEKIKRQLSIQIEFEDERFTSRVAAQQLREIPKDDQAVDIDALSAVLILESWLNRQNPKNPPPERKS
ncbi:MAG: Holliday junction resolvase RuvX [bacterium]